MRGARGGVPRTPNLIFEMSSHEWTFHRRCYDREKRESSCAREEVSEHPLKPMFVAVTASKGTRGPGSGLVGSILVSEASSKSVSAPMDPLTSVLEGTDPLSQFMSDADPLSRMAAECPEEREVAVGQKEALEETFEPWHVKKGAILSKYTTSEKLSIVTSFLSGGQKVIVKAQSSVSEKVKTRLEQLDDFEEGSVKEMLSLTQQEYVHRIEQLNQALIEAWEENQRVRALKIVIQCAKLLADTAVIQFYPSKFVLITDILDTFGNLVFDRIHAKAEYLNPATRRMTQLPENFTPEMVPESAKETCRNWFFKIASIRELIPRFYVEVAILKSYGFLTLSEFSDALMRLTKMICGIGDPLVAAYARCYLCRVGILVAPEARDYLYENFYDFLTTYSQLTCVHVQNELLRQKVDFTAYMILYSPALDWVLQCIAHKSTEALLTQIMDRCRHQCNRFAFSSSGLILNSIMTAFKPVYIANRALLFVELMKECQDSGFPKHFLFRTLGLCLVVASPPESQRLEILNNVWKVVAKLKHPAEYMNCAEVWVEYPVKHFTKREVNTLLGDIIKHMTPDRVFEQHYPQLQSVVDRVLLHIHDFSQLFSMDKFLPFLDMFQKESVRVEVCKLIMEAFARHQTTGTSDPVIINALMFVCKTMHDSINALTVEDEKRQISCLISNFLRKVSFERDFEQQLSFYVEARAVFTNLDPILITLVQCVNKLAMDTRNIVKGHHTRKTAAFVRACAAYSFITIPSLMDVFARFQLYLSTGQVALLNQCLGQADACFKAIIGLVSQVPRTIEIDGNERSSEPLLISFLNNFLSTLLVVPDNPDHGVLYLMRGLLNALQECAWEPHSDALMIVYIQTIGLLSTSAQELYPYHIEKVDSNDSLYGSDPKFVAEVVGMCQTLLEQILNHLNALEETECFKRQSRLALHLLNCIITFGDLNSDSTKRSIASLWSIPQKYGSVDTKLMMRTLEHIKHLSAKSNDRAYLEIVSKLQASSTV